MSGLDYVYIYTRFMDEIYIFRMDSSVTDQGVECSVIVVRTPDDSKEISID